MESLALPLLLSVSVGLLVFTLVMRSLRKRRQDGYAAARLELQRQAAYFFDDPGVMRLLYLLSIGTPVEDVAAAWKRDRCSGSALCVGAQGLVNPGPQGFQSVCVGAQGLVNPGPQGFQSDCGAP